MYEVVVDRRVLARSRRPSSAATRLVEQYAAVLDAVAELNREPIRRCRRSSSASPATPSATPSSIRPAAPAAAAHGGVLPPARRRCRRARRAQPGHRPAGRRGPAQRRRLRPGPVVGRDRRRPPPRRRRRCAAAVLRRDPDRCAEPRPVGRQLVGQVPDSVGGPHRRRRRTDVSWNSRSPVISAAKLYVTPSEPTAVHVNVVPTSFVGRLVAGRVVERQPASPGRRPPSSSSMNSSAASWKLCCVRRAGGDGQQATAAATRPGP